MKDTSRLGNILEYLVGGQQQGRTWKETQSMRIFPHLRCFHGYSLPLSIPLFRSRRFNPGFSTQFGALHSGLYALARLTQAGTPSSYYCLYYPPILDRFILFHPPFFLLSLSLVLFLSLSLLHTFSPKLSFHPSSIPFFFSLYLFSFLSTFPFPPL